MSLSGNDDWWALRLLRTASVLQDISDIEISPEAYKIRHLLGASTKVDHGRRAEAWEELVFVKEPRKSYCTCNTEPLQEWSPIDDSHDYSCHVHSPCRCDRDARQCFSIMKVAESADRAEWSKARHLLLAWNVCIKRFSSWSTHRWGRSDVVWHGEKM